MDLVGYKRVTKILAQFAENYEVNNSLEETETVFPIVLEIHINKLYRYVSIKA